jgi:phosphate starvation-inducible PhoH-like protein
MMSWRNTMFYGIQPTNQQAKFLDAVENPSKKVIIVDAKAGTGKTTLSVAIARILGMKLVYVFAPVQEKVMGFRPGDQKTKEKEYLPPLRDALLKINEKPAQAIASEEDMNGGKFGNSKAWVYPMSHIFLRGCNIENAIIVIDEAQNYTKTELKKILTRIHDSCKVILIGDTFQCDLPNPKLSGFERVKQVYGPKRFTATIRLTKNFRGKISQTADEI